MLWGEGGDPVGYALTDWSLSLGSWGRSDQKWDILGTDLGLENIPSVLWFIQGNRRNK